MKENRRHVRLIHRASIKVTLKNQTTTAYTRDISDSGLFILHFTHTENLTININDIFEITVIGIQDALPRKVRVVRIEPDKGIAVEFVEE